MASIVKISSSRATRLRRPMAIRPLRRLAILPVILVLLFTGAACTSDNAQSLFESAQLEERQNNPAHAKELYREILTKYPKSEYASKAEERLRHLDQKK